jgi:very-short-patch-repair endonuclease
MGIDIHLRPDIGGKSDTGSADAAIARLAMRQHGVVSRAQLAELGLGARAIDHRLERSRLHVVHRAVFAVGHTVLSRHGTWVAAVLAAGHGAVLSHRAAAALSGIRGWAGGRVDVTVPRNRKTRRGIEIHRSVLAADEITAQDGIPVTTPVRTLLDLAGVLSLHQLERAVHETEYRRLTSPLSLDALLTRHQGRRGTAALRKIADQDNLGSTLTRSELEIAFLAFLDAHHLERPKVNERIGPYTVDALWPQQRLVAELDSRQAHQTTRAFEEDRARDRHLLTKGYRVVRVTHRQLHHESATIAAQLRQLLTPDTVRAP